MTRKPGCVSPLSSTGFGASGGQASRKLGTRKFGGGKFGIPNRHHVPTNFQIPSVFGNLRDLGKMKFEIKFRKFELKSSKFELRG